MARRPRQGSLALVVPLPQSSRELLLCRKKPSKASLTDLVEHIHIGLWDDASYRALWNATFDDEAVEGSVLADTFSAALRVRAVAVAGVQENGFLTLVANEKLARISKALCAVVRRYGISRSERRARVADAPAASSVAVDMDALSEAISH